MKNPWKDLKAFEPMYDEEISIVLKNGENQSIRCIVFGDSSGDPIADQMIDTDRMDISINVLQDDWCLIKNLGVGDKIERVVNGIPVEYAVTSLVDDNIQGKIIKARSTTSTSSTILN